MVATPPPLQIIIWGPSCAPVQAFVMTIAFFKPSGVQYTKVPPPINCQ